MPIYPAGFLPYASDDDSILASASLKSSADLGIGAEEGTGIIYDSNLGVQVGTAGVIRFANIPGNAALDNSGHFRLKISGDWITNDYSATGSENIFQAQGNVCYSGLHRISAGHLLRYCLAQTIHVVNRSFSRRRKK